ncbi:MAG: hypothetical protein JO165_07505 [Candidatus Eremiobacteraeota bacterium]|nr:hypothetical protein [Candidatus Eremiobacteraeota bacterium]
MNRVVRAFIVIGVCSVLLLITGPPMLDLYTTAYTGFHSEIGAFPGSVPTTVDAGSPAYRAGLRSGDLPKCLSLRDSEIFYPTFQDAAYTADPVSACVLRDGIVKHVVVTAQPGPPVKSLYGSRLFAFLRFLVYVIYLIVASVLVLARPNLATWLLFASSIATAPFAAGLGGFTTWNSATYGFSQVFLQQPIILGSILLLAFILVVPDAEIPHGWRRTALFVTFIAAAMVAIYRFYSVLHAPTITNIISDPVPQRIIRAATYAVIIATFVRLLTMRSDERARFAWVAVGIIVGVIANDLRTKAGNDIASNLAGFVTVVTPVSVLYAILRRHVLDVRFVISRTVVYGVLTTLVVGVIAAVDWATSIFLSQYRVALAIDALVTIALGVALHRTYGFIENFVDFLVYRRKHEAETYLKRLARTLLRAEREETVDHAIVTDPYERLQLTMAALFRKVGNRYGLVYAEGWAHSDALAFQSEHDIVRFLAAERSRLHIADLRSHVASEFIDAGAVPAVAVPIFEGDNLAAFTLYGLHRDGTKLDPDEIETLEVLCETAAQAYLRIENLQYRALFGTGTERAPA